MNKWKELIDQESVKDYYKQLSSFVKEDAKQHTIYPHSKDVLNAFKLTPLHTVKVVILGQDPYHGAGQAHGLAFSVLPDCPIPPSLKNIFKEINSDLQVDMDYPDGCLVDWATQGVLLLNTVLTVRANQANSHRDKGWETFTDAVISTLNDVDRPLVFMLWGNHAKSKKKLITNTNHLVLEAAHPSPLSAYSGFFGCKHFSKANEFLSVDNGIQPIEWLPVDVLDGEY
jgi:uracil-DNA glycosylase